MSSVAIRSRRLGVSARIDARLAAVTGALAVACLAAVAVNVSYGEFGLPVTDVVATLFGFGDEATRVIVLDLRLPRALVALFAGAALAMSGVIFQTFGRNALASPDIIGVTTGAAFAGVSAFVLGASPELAPLAAFGGALTATALMYGLAWRDGLSPFRLVLVGVGISALALAGISFVLIQGRVEQIQEAYTWLVGSVNLRAWSDFWPLAAGLAVLVPLTAVLTRSLDALALGDETARSLGVHVERTRLALVAVGAGLAAVGVAAAGPVAFVAFVAPLIARRLTGVHGAAVMPAAALCGAAMMPAADVLGRIVFAPAEMPVGIVTSLLGAPVFLFLLYRANRAKGAA
jgi:iron complex transport system permease protein